jgi:hypothetical protein
MHDLGATDGVMQYAFIYDCDEHGGIIAGQNLLARQPRFDLCLDVDCVRLAVILEYRAGVASDL